MEKHKFLFGDKITRLVNRITQNAYHFNTSTYYKYAYCLLMGVWRFCFEVLEDADAAIKVNNEAQKMLDLHRQLK